MGQWLATWIGAVALASAAVAAETPKVLRVGMDTGYAPLSFEQNGKMEGVEADFAHEIGREWGIEVKLIPMKFQDLIPALQKKRIDVIMSGMSITDERQKLVSFAQPYLEIGQMAVIRKADLLELGPPEAMDQTSSRVGFQSGTTGEKFARENLKKATLVALPSVDAGLAALRAKKIDFFIHDAPTIWRLRGWQRSANDDLIGRYRPLTHEELAWAVRKDDAALLDHLNATLAKWKKDRLVESILDQWIVVRKVTK
jgi:ABC-type amino acid transport substrate-binding protein